MERTYTLELSKAELFFVLNILEKSLALYTVIENTNIGICDRLARKIERADEDA